jgi:hypothetical protein
VIAQVMEVYLLAIPFLINTFTHLEYRNIL